MLAKQVQDLYCLLMCTKIFPILVHIKILAVLLLPAFILTATLCSGAEIEITGTEGTAVTPAQGLQERQSPAAEDIPSEAAAAPDDPAASSPAPEQSPEQSSGQTSEQASEQSTALAAQENSAGRHDEEEWLALEPGLQYRELKKDSFRLHVLRIDPAFYSFVLCSSGKENSEQMTLQEWSEKKDLIASINASMYLPDGQTSTGYMRDGEYINNKRMVQRFGAFFVADPDDPDLPQAAILEKDDDIGKELLPHYRLVIQNYRIINSQRRILWSPGGPLYSISAVAMDGDGNVLFLHSQVPIEAYAFAQQLLHLPLDVRTVMYVEGGGQAGLVIRSHKFSREVQGQNIVDFLITGNRAARLPNVLGIRRKH